MAKGGEKWQLLAIAPCGSNNRSCISVTASTSSLSPSKAVMYAEEETEMLKKGSRLFFSLLCDETDHFLSPDIVAVLMPL